MIGIAHLLMVTSSPEFSVVSKAPNVKAIDELHEQEVATVASLKFDGQIPVSLLHKCIPGESRPLPSSWPSDLRDQAFPDSEINDLKKCTPESCLFKFLPYERDLISKLNNEKLIEDQIFKFLLDRVEKRTPVDPRSSAVFIRSAEEPFSSCASSQLNQLLDARPLTEHAAWRLSVSKYDKRMRPTIRLTQGFWIEASSEKSCFVEAMIFSTHYDADRVDVWTIEKRAPRQMEVQLMVRNRLDFLNSWWRRLQKSELREQVQKIAKAKMEAFQACLRP